jgi:hypothetical protein
VSHLSPIRIPIWVLCRSLEGHVRGTDDSPGGARCRLMSL